MEAKNYGHIKQTLLDPAVNHQFQKLKEALEASEKRLKEKQDELDAVKFQPSSMTGRRLIAKCKLLQEENDEFGMLISEDKLHKLENELSIQRDLTEEYKNALYGQSSETYKKESISFDGWFSFIWKKI